MKKQEIFYDATFQILAPHRGMATYLNNFLQALSLSGLNITGLAPYNLKGRQEGNITYYGLNNILLFEQFSIPAFTKEVPVDFFIFPYNTGPVFKKLNCRSVLFLHDLIFMEPFSKIPLSNSIKQTIGRCYRRVAGPRMIRKADFIVTVSEYSKKRIIEECKVSEDKITVIPNCIDISPGDERLEEKDRLGYFLNVGGDAAHKNTVFLIEGYSKLPAEIKEKHSLKIVGIANGSNKQVLKQLIKSLSEEDNITIEEFVDDYQLEQLYRGAFIFIFPSLMEGFGIPLLEAMKYGCSIVCSNTSSMPEVCGDSAFYFDPKNIQSFLNAVCLACVDPGLRQAKKKAAIQQIQDYSRINFNKKAIDWVEKNIRKRF